MDVVFQNTKQPVRAVGDLLPGLLFYHPDKEGLVDIPLMRTYGTGEHPTKAWFVNLMSGRCGYFEPDEKVYLLEGTLSVRFA